MAITEARKEAQQEMGALQPSNQCMVAVHRQVQGIQIQHREIDAQNTPLLGDNEFDKEVESITQYETEMGE